MEIRSVNSNSAPAYSAPPSNAAAARAPDSAPKAAAPDAAGAPASAAQLQAAGTAPRPAPEKQALTEAVKSINIALQDRSPGLEFSIDGDSERTVVKVIDKETQEVIRQMPSREALEIAKMIDNMQGLLEKQSA
jgi:flagellar protein FlaG